MHKIGFEAESERGLPMPASRKPLPPPVVRREPPTIEEAIFAAQGLASDTESQVEIAAGLMGVPPEEVRPLMSRATTTQRPPLRSGKRVVIVERRAPRSSATALRR